MRRPPALLPALLLPFLAVPVAAQEGPAAGGVPPHQVLVIEGRGWGHGVGMAQDGALAMGLDGHTSAEILGHFYPGTSFGTASGVVPVNVHQPADGQVVLAFPGGGDVRSPQSGAQHAGFPLKVSPGGHVRVWAAEGGFAVDVEDGFTTAGASPHGDGRDAWSGAPVWAVPDADGTISLPIRARRYRGATQVTGGPFRVVNHVHVEDYLRGMGEVRDSSWPQASLQAQAIAARTYALRTVSGGGEICDTQRCQVYLGAQAEYGAMDKAVADTAGMVLTYGGGYAVTVYSANAGGQLATEYEGFGEGSYEFPYLRSAPYATRDPMPWTVEKLLPDVARRAGYPGALESVAVSEAGPSGRAVEVTLAGDAGQRAMSGLEFKAAMGLKSNLFEVRVEQRGTPPPPAAAPTAPDAELAVAAAAAATMVEPARAPLVTPPVAAAPDAERVAGADPLGRWSTVAAAMLALVAVAVALEQHRHPTPHHPGPSPSPPPTPPTSRGSQVRARARIRRRRAPERHET